MKLDGGTIVNMHFGRGENLDDGEGIGFRSACYCPLVGEVCSGEGVDLYLVDLDADGISGACWPVGGGIVELEAKLYLIVKLPILILYLGKGYLLRRVEHIVRILKASLLPTPKNHLLGLELTTEQTTAILESRPAQARTAVG